MIEGLFFIAGMALGAFGLLALLCLGE